MKSRLIEQPFPVILSFILDGVSLPMIRTGYEDAYFLHSGEKVDSRIFLNDFPSFNKEVEVKNNFSWIDNNIYMKVNYPVDNYLQLTGDNIGKVVFINNENKTEPYLGKVFISNF